MMTNQNTKATKKVTATRKTSAKVKSAEAPRIKETKARATARKTRSPSGEKQPKRTSALDAAAQVLKSAGKPMRSQELIDAMAASGLWKSPGGKTPHATLYAAILREMTARGKEARFRKVDRGQFEFAGKGRE